jgi:cytochrome c-type biogenesis protein CcmH
MRVLGLILRSAHAAWAYARLEGRGLRCVARAALALLCLVSLLGTAHAVQPDEVLPDPALESRARTLSRELRCMVCQNQSIDDSDAPLAGDLRMLVRERLKAGDSDREVLDFLTARYGEFVLLKPRITWHNALLWFGPPGLLVLGGLVLFLAARRRGQQAAVVTPAAALTPAEQSRLAGLLEADEPPQKPASRG